MRMDGTVVAGIDVGGQRKGFHAVALKNGRYFKRCASRSAEDIATWCRRIGASVVSVDAPCRWSATGRAREAERVLMNAGIWCFSTPRRQSALSHPRKHYGWMLEGEKLYQALERDYYLFRGRSTARRRPIVFETFPHAVACALLGRVVSARTKRRDRTHLLSRHAVATESLSNIDYIDAAICALASQFFEGGRYLCHGDSFEGHIVVPDRRGWRSRRHSSPPPPR